jgi:hypothetical protein
MDIDLMFLGAFLAFFLLFTAAYLFQRLQWRRKTGENKKRYGFYPSAAALSLALLSLQTLAQPDLHHSLEERQSEADDTQEDGDPDDPFAQLNHQLKRIRNNEPVNDLQVPYCHRDRLQTTPRTPTKSLVKPQNHLTHSPSRTSEWHVSRLKQLYLK